MRRSAARQWDWVSGGLLFLLLQIPAARLVATDWTKQLYWTETLAALGTILGLALGSSRFGRRAVAILVVGYTAVLVPWQLTRSAVGDSLLDRLRQTGAILGVSLTQFLQRQAVKDPLLFLLFVCLAFWLMGVSAGYWLARFGRVLASIALSGAAIVTIQAYGNYQPRGSWWLAIFVLLGLLLVGRVHLQQQKKRWAVARVFVSEDAGLNLFGGLFLTAALAILAAWSIPGSPGGMQRAANTWNAYVEPIRERLSHAVTSLSGPYGKLSPNFYGGSLPLGLNAAVGDAVVLRIEVLDSPGINLRYYWRGRLYNDYEDGSWSASGTSRMPFDPEADRIVVPDAADRSEGVFRVTSHFPVQSLIYAPSPAVWVDRAANLAGMPTSPRAYDVFSWETRMPVLAASTYQVRAALRNPTIVQLRGAGESYPDWITAGYLGVPDQYRSQLADLAEMITAGSETAYDKATAVTNYLRANIVYSPRLPAVPENQDPVMWVLLSHKEGFCNYYASAEVLLLRSMGIPARLAVGFARGNLEDGGYTVYRRNAHAWPEVYFPNIGWVEFEPTANQDPLVRPSGLEADAGAASGTQQPRDREEALSRIPELVELAPPATPIPFRLTPVGKALYTAGPVVALAIAVALGYRLRVWNRLPALVARTIEAGGGPVPSWLRQWEHWHQLQPVERAFASVGWSLRLLGAPQSLEATPSAQAAALARRLPSAAAHIDVLRAELETGLFTARTEDLSRARRAAIIVLLRALRARLGATLAALDGRAAYYENNPKQTERGMR